MSESFFRDQTEQPAEAPPEIQLEPEDQQPADSPTDESLSDEGRLAAIMSYIPFLCFIPLINVNLRDNVEARFHARQGVILFLIEIVAVVLLIDDLARFVFKSLLVLAAALSFTGIYYALQGRKMRLPLIGDLADKAKI